MYSVEHKSKRSKIGKGLDDKLRLQTAKQQWSTDSECTAKPFSDMARRHFRMALVDDKYDNGKVMPEVETIVDASLTVLSIEHLREGKKEQGEGAVYLVL